MARWRPQPAAFALDHEARGDAQGPFKIAFAWMYVPQNQGYWHNGGTGGYTSEAAFNLRQDTAIVVLYNRDDIDPVQSKAQFSSQVFGNVVRVMNGMEPLPLQ
jgi:Beta-lactamase